MPPSHENAAARISVVGDGEASNEHQNELEGDEGPSGTPVQRQLRQVRDAAELFARESLGRNAEEEENGFSLTKYPIREWRFRLSCLSGREVAVNPLVAIIGVVCLWSIVIWCSVDQTNALNKLVEWRTILSLHTTWFFQGSKACFFFFVLYIWVRYGHITLGNKDDEPEFSTITYACMVLTAGAGNGLLVYSVFEPLLNRRHHYYANAGYRSQDEIDMFAVNITVASWGLGGWASYAVVAVAMSLAVYRFRLPMTLRSCFYPILGPYTWGWIGDVIDGFTVVFTLAGIFTSLGLVPQNFTAGLFYLEWIKGSRTDDHIAAIESTVIWLITVLSLIAVFSGLQHGVRYLSIAAVIIASTLLFFVLLHDDTKFLLNLQVQTVGYYFQTSIFQHMFWTDAFGQLREGSGRAIDGRAADQDWMESSQNYIMGWWIAAASLNGQFICSISRGRKIWEVIVYSVIAPVAFCLVWFCVWGGVGLRHVRQATELERLGERHFNDSAHFAVNGSELCFNVPQHDISLHDEKLFTIYLKGVSPVCNFDERDSDSAVYHVFNSFSLGKRRLLGPVLSLLFMLACVLFYLVGAATAALFVDKLTSSGRKTGIYARRVFWTVTVGALASVLFVSGGTDALAIVRAAMIICGLPCAIMVCYLMQTVTLMCAAAENMELDTMDYPFPDQPEFSMPVYGGVFNVLEYLTSFGRVNCIREELGIYHATRFQVVEFAKGLFVPFVSLYQVLSATYPQNPKSNASLTALFAASYIGWVATLAASFTHPGVRGTTWTLFAMNGFILAMIRSNFRAQYNLRSNAAGDFVSSAFFWPQVLAQMRLQRTMPP